MRTLNFDATIARLILHKCPESLINRCLDSPNKLRKIVNLCLDYNVAPQYY